MTANKVTDPLSIAKAYRLQHWGFTWIVLGFLVLIQELFGLNSLVLALAAILIGIALPKARPQASRLRSVLEYAGYLSTFIIVPYGLIWLSKVLHLNTGLVLSLASLAVGILLQAWAEILRRSQSPEDRPAYPLIDKIRHL